MIRNLEYDACCATINLRLGPHLFVSTFSQLLSQLVRRQISCLLWVIHVLSPLLYFPSLFVFPLCLPLSGRHPNITLQPQLRATSLPKPNHSKIPLTLLFRLPQSQTPISAVAHVRETVHVAKCLNPPLLCFCCLCLAIPPHSLSAIYIWASKFFHS